ncbi:MAG: DNA gyrase inhibitor YacG [Immundisolibacter sp.]
MLHSVSTPCPICGAPSVWSVDNPYRPFCSERCKLADLGSWLNGDYRLPLDALAHERRLDEDD